MAPKKNKKKAAGPVMTEEDMRLMGMSEEDISRIMHERSKTSEEKKVEQEQKEAQRREAEKRARLHKEIVKKCDDLVMEEQNERVTILKDEDKEWVISVEPLEAEKIKILRQHAKMETARKHQLATKQYEEKVQKLKERLSKLDPEERAAITAELQEKEKERTLALLEHEEAKRKRAERRQARLAARRAKENRHDESDISDADSGDEVVFSKDLDFDAEISAKYGL